MKMPATLATPWGILHLQWQYEQMVAAQFLDVWNGELCMDFQEFVLPDFPLLGGGSPFAQKVFAELMQIPMGEVRTYSDLARQMGQPLATRAVARVLASNPVALWVPCHRVVSKTQGVGGYRWGSERKKSILAWEQNCRY